MKEKKEPITARPKWDEKKNTFVIPKNSGYTVDESILVQCMGDFLAIVALDIKTPIEDIIKVTEYHRSVDPNITFAHRALYQFMFEHFPTGLYLFEAVLGKNDTQLRALKIAQKRFLKDTGNVISYNGYQAELMKKYPNMKKIQLPPRSVLIPVIEETVIASSEFNAVAPDELVEIVFEVIHERFGIDLSVHKFGTKEKCIPHNLFVSRKVSIGIVYCAYGKDFNFFQVYDYFGNKRERSQLDSFIFHYKRDHFVHIQRDKVYGLLFNHIYEAVLEKVKIETKTE
jgi:hypothetical protein